jgi:hypothetical protein
VSGNAATGRGPALYKQHVIRLTPTERQELKRLLRHDATTALEQRRARILLASDATVGAASPTDLAVAAAVGVDPRTVARVRATFARDGFAVALHGQPRRFPPRGKLSSAQEARVAALARSTPPPGQARWTLRLLAARLVALEVVPSICAETVRTTLKKSSCSRGASSAGSSRPRPMPASRRRWKTCAPSTTDRSMRRTRWSVATRPAKR